MITGNPMNNGVFFTFSNNWQPFFVSFLLHTTPCWPKKGCSFLTIVSIFLLDTITKQLSASSQSMIACKKWMFYNASNHEQISHWKCISFFCRGWKKVMLPPTYKLKQPFLYSMQNPLFKTAGPSHAYTFLFWISGVKSTEKGRPALLSTTFAGLPYFSFQHSC